MKEDRKEGYVKYATGLVFVVLSHHLIFLTMLLSIIILILSFWKTIAKKPAIFAKIFGISLVGMVFTTAYWLPALEQALKIKLKALYDNAYSLSEHILTFEDIVLVHIGLLLSLLFAAAIILFFVILIKNKEMKTDAVSLFVVNAILIFLSCSRAFWTSNVGQALNFFQYTQRFVFVLTVTMIMFVIVVLRDAIPTFDVSFSKGKAYYPAVIAVCMLLLVFLTRNFARPGFFELSKISTMELNPSLYADDYEVSMGEWLPSECEPTACLEPYVSKADDKSTAEGVKSEGAVYYDVWLLMDKKYYDVPYVYYYGYKAYLMDDGGNPVKELEVGEAYDDNGYVRVFLPEGGSGAGHVLVTYRKTALQKVSYVISALATLAIIVAFAVYFVPKKERAK
ncbi:MAG: hypothetical protein K6C96_11195 [Butyrivibrio sp.]|nr:hypothetical protein [Butyrivibrio sp.]